jgi:hypothetical protein
MILFGMSCPFWDQNERVRRERERKFGGMVVKSSAKVKVRKNWNAWLDKDILYRCFLLRFYQ